MPSYQHAKPFDIVRTIKNLQNSVKQLQIRLPGQTTAWTDVAFAVASVFTVPTNGYIKYRKTIENEIQISFSVQLSTVVAVNPGSLISSAVPYIPTSAVAAASITNTSLGGHWASIACDSQASNGGVNFNAVGAAITVTSEGFLYVRGIGSGSHYVAGDVRIPLDV